MTLALDYLLVTNTVFDQTKKEGTKKLELNIDRKDFCNSSDHSRYFPV